jgi:hypothetical protein
VLFAVFIFSVLVLPIWQYLIVAKKIDGFVPDVGIVIDHVKNGYGHKVRFHSIIEYRGSKGETKKFTSIVGRYPSDPIGCKVKILIDTKSRLVVYEAGFGGSWLGSIIVSSICATLLAFASGLYLVCLNGNPNYLDKISKNET